MFANPVRRALPVLVACSAIAACTPESEPAVEVVPVVTLDRVSWTEMLDEEDARGTGASGITALQEGLTASDPELQRLAVRGIGRLEDPQHIPLTFPLLFSDDEAVRAETVNALGQATHGALGDEVADVLFDHLARENQESAAVRAAIGRTLGRLRYADTGRFRRAEQTLLDLTREGSGTAAAEVVLGAVMGLESMARGTGRGRMSEESVERLGELSSLGRGVEALGTADQARVRRVAIMALSTIGQMGPNVLESAMGDPDPDVRRLAVVAIGRGLAGEGATALLLDALADPFPRIRVEAVRAYAARVPGAQECPLLFSSARDEDLHVALAAIDLLQEPCDDRPAQDAALIALAARVGNAGPHDWQRGAAALLSLAVVSPDAAFAFVGPAAGSTSPFVRMYVARAATTLGSTDVLEALTRDSSPNVRTVALQGLFELTGHAVDSLLVAQLEEEDPQLLLTVARLLEGTTRRAQTVGPLIAALGRVSERQLETARDTRMALLDRISELGDVEQAPALERYLNDYDSVVAARAAGILTDWTSGRRLSQADPLPRLALPSPEELQRLAGTRVVLEMLRGGEIEIRLLVDEAPTNAARFELLAASGYFDGLTFHRVVTNYVLQGGSPGANEYVGDAAYTRDEVGLVPHWRGTVGTSTRGRDTGDGQIFINLVDNLALNHEYTVFGEVVRGMEVADQVAEGDVIVRARVIRP